MQQRYYDPVAGRFLSIDPVTTDANTGSSFNRYFYANNSPYKYVDPDGRKAECSWRTLCAEYNVDGGGSSARGGANISGAANGATIGLVIGIGLSGACDVISSGVCTVANPWIIGGTTAVVGGLVGSIFDKPSGPIFAKPPSDAKDPDGAKAPGKPGEAQGFKDPKGGENWVQNPNPGRGGGSHGWLDSKGNVWVPSGQGGRAHGGPHWDVQKPNGDYENIKPPR
jgi:uncharacterized protein RhaS with RHS repeats